MLNSVSFTCTAMNGLNKVGLIKPDSDGYYRVVLGALNVYNSSGEYYAYEGAKHLFERSSSLMRRVARGALRSENGHPKWLPGMSEDEYARRIMQIYEERVCAHIRQVDLVFDKYKDDKGRRIIGIEGLVRPDGELGYVLENALKNPHHNVAFSIRSFTENIRSYTGVTKILKSIITWDLVTEPGIPIAEKYYSPSLESLTEKKFSRNTLERAYYSKDTNTNSPSMESVKMNAAELFHSLGWVNSDESQPSYLKW